MTRKDWLCPVCGDVMLINPQGKYMVCFKGHGKLRHIPLMSDLPMAVKLNDRDFWITYIDSSAGKAPRYQYVPHWHKTALDQAPPEGCVVASVAFRGHRAVRLFRRKKTLIERLVEHHFGEYVKEAKKWAEAAGK